MIERPVGGHRNAVDGVEGGHHRIGAGFDRGLEWGKIAIVQLRNRDLGAVVVAAALRGAVADEVLGRGGEAALAVSFDACRREGRAEEGVLAGALDDASPAGIARHVDHRRKRQVHADGRRLAGNGFGGGLGELWAPRGGPGDRRRKRRAERVDGIDAEQERDAEARRARGLAEGLDVLAVGHIQHGPDAALADLLELLLGRKGHRRKIELADLLGERHARKERIDRGLDGRFLEDGKCLDG